MRSRRLLIPAAVAMVTMLAAIRPAPASASGDCAGKKTKVTMTNGTSFEYCKPTCTPPNCDCRPAVCPDATSVNND